MERNEFNQIRCTHPQLFADNEYWLDWSAFCEISGLASTCLYRTLKALPDTENYKYKYKNRWYWKTTFVFSFWRHVSDANKNQNKK